MAEKKTTLQPLNVSTRLHEKTKIIAALSRKGIAEIADEIYLPVAERRESALIAEASKKQQSAR